MHLQMHEARLATVAFKRQRDSLDSFDSLLAAEPA
jgi:hypothetical protein